MGKENLKKYIWTGVNDGLGIYEKYTIKSCMIYMKKPINKIFKHLK